MKSILFVCTGNTCRSPMAQVLFNKMMQDACISDIRAQSAGIAASAGAPASQNAVLAAGELGAELAAHQSRQITREMVEGCDAVYTMSPSHAAVLKNAFPDCAGKIHVLGSGIPDPYGGDIEIYRRCRDSILAAIKILTKQVIQ